MVVVLCVLCCACCACVLHVPGSHIHNKRPSAHTGLPPRVAHAPATSAAPPHFSLPHFPPQGQECENCVNRKPITLLVDITQALRDIGLTPYEVELRVAALDENMEASRREYGSVPSCVTHQDL